MLCCFYIVARQRSHQNFAERRRTERRRTGRRSRIATTHETYFRVNFGERLRLGHSPLTKSEYNILLHFIFNSFLILEYSNNEYHNNIIKICSRL